MAKGLVNEQNMKSAQESLTEAGEEFTSIPPDNGSALIANGSLQPSS
jgi:hypothetical protein